MVLGTDRITYLSNFDRYKKKNERYLKIHLLKNILEMIYTKKICTYNIETKYFLARGVLLSCLPVNGYLERIRLRGGESRVIVVIILYLRVSRLTTTDKFVPVAEDRVLLTSDKPMFIISTTVGDEVTKNGFFFYVRKEL